jgi:hypothetical protein
MRLFKSRGNEGVCWPLDAGEEVDSEKGSLDFVLHLDLSQGTVRYMLAERFSFFDLKVQFDY